MRTHQTLLGIGAFALLALATLPPPAAAAAAPFCVGVSAGFGSCQISCDVFSTGKVVRVAAAGDSGFPYGAAVGYSGCGAGPFVCYFSYVVDPGPGAATCASYVPATTGDGELTCFADWFVGPFTCVATAV